MPNAERRTPKGGETESGNQGLFHRRGAEAQRGEEGLFPPGVFVFIRVHSWFKDTLHDSMITTALFKHHGELLVAREVEPKRAAAVGSVRDLNPIKPGFKISDRMNKMKQEGGRANQVFGVF